MTSTEMEGKQLWNVMLLPNVILDPQMMRSMKYFWLNSACQTRDT